MIGVELPENEKAPDTQVDKDKFDGVLRKIAWSKPLPAKELIGKLPTSRVVKPKKKAPES